ncbi:MAG: cation acetate symporter, partial [Gammaproteobacteria bacterium]
TVWVEILGNATAVFPYKYPALFSMLASFAVTMVVSLLDRSATAERERRAFDHQYVRSITGMGAAEAARH